MSTSPTAIPSALAALAALAAPSADRALWTRGPFPVVVVPDGTEPGGPVVPSETAVPAAR